MNKSGMVGMIVLVFFVQGCGLRIVTKKHFNETVDWIEHDAKMGAIQKLNELAEEYGTYQRKNNCGECSYVFSAMLRKKRLELLDWDGKP